MRTVGGRETDQEQKKSVKRQPVKKPIKKEEVKK